VAIAYTSIWHITWDHKLQSELPRELVENMLSASSGDNDNSKRPRVFGKWACRGWDTPVKLKFGDVKEIWLCKSHYQQWQW